MDCQYHVYILARYETFSDIEMAIQREKRLKKWWRSWKIELIQKSNPMWMDLYQDLTDGHGSPLARG